MDFFGDEKKYAVELYSAPTQVAPIVNGVRKGNSFLAPTGGVQIEATEALAKENIQRWTK